MEVEVIKPMWHEGKPIGPAENGESNPVIDLSESDATYLIGIGRVRKVVDDESSVKKPAKGKAK